MTAALLIGDLHCGDRVILRRPRLGITLQQLDDALGLWLQYSLLEPAPIRIVFAGDLLDTKIGFPLDVYLGVLQIFQKYQKMAATYDIDMRKYVHWLAGNHEKPDAARTDRTLMWLFDAYATLVVDEPRYITHEGTPSAAIALVPWNPRERFLGQIHEVIRATTAYDNRYLVTHVGLKEGSASESNTTSEKIADVSLQDLQPAHWAGIYLGDFHACHRVGDSNAMYLGAPIPHKFNDVNNPRGGWLLNTEDGSLKRVAFPSAYPSFHQLVVDTEEKIEQLAAQGLVEGDYYRLFTTTLLWKVVEARFPGTEVRVQSYETDAVDAPAESRMEAAAGASHDDSCQRWLEYRGVPVEEHAALLQCGLGMLKEGKG